MRHTLSISSIAVFVTAAIGAPVTASETHQNQPYIEHLSTFEIPAGALHGEESCIGGLSAIDYDAETDRYFVLSDDKQDPRFFVFEIRIDGEPPRIAAATSERVVVLTTRERVSYANGTIDPEGLVLTGGSRAWISSEGNVERDIPPFVDAIDTNDGTWISSLTLPPELRPTGEDDSRSGVRQNRGLEALALSPDRTRLITATESSLEQDAPGKTTFARLYTYQLGPVPHLVATYLYPIEAPAGHIVAHGLVELQTLDESAQGETRLLALERTFGPEIGLIVRLFTVSLPSNSPRLSEPVANRIHTSPQLSKELLFDFGERGIALENYEGITFGPKLADGRRSLIIIGDNDNPRCRFPLLRPTRILLFAFGRPD